jgi:cell division protein FtsX
MTDDDLTRTTSSIDTRLTRLTWTVNLWGGAITILLVITLFLASASIRAYSP